MPSKYAVRIAQAFTATDPSVKVRGDQWEELPDLAKHTDCVGTIPPQLRDMIWEAKRNATRHVRENRVPPSAFHFGFFGYNGVVVVDHRLQGIKMRLPSRSASYPC
jgi:RNA-dependent RNA polymerase